MNDSEYLSEPVQFSARLDYGPDLKHSNEEYALGIARRFLKENQEQTL